MLHEVVRKHNLGVVDSPKKLPSSKGANPVKKKSQNVDLSYKLSLLKGANPEKMPRARIEKSTASKKSTQASSPQE